MPPAATTSSVPRMSPVWLRRAGWMPANGCLFSPPNAGTACARSEAAESSGSALVSCSDASGAGSPSGNSFSFSGASGAFSGSLGAIGDIVVTLLSAGAAAAPCAVVRVNDAETGGSTEV